MPLDELLIALKHANETRNTAQFRALWQQLVQEHPLTAAEIAVRYAVATD